MKDEKIKKIWRQKQIPVVYLPEKSKRGNSEPVLLRLPFHENNREWIQNSKSRKPKWNEQQKHWEIPRAWFNEVIERILVRFGHVYVIQSFREQQKCAPACWNAEGFECECSCHGLNHGAGRPEGRWYVVSEACAVQWDERKLHYKLLIAS
jgi:hypothetical protein